MAPLLAAIQLGVVYLSQSTYEVATERSARTVLTGSAQANSTTPSAPARSFRRSATVKLTLGTSPGAMSGCGAAIAVGEVVHDGRAMMRGTPPGRREIVVR